MAVHNYVVTGLWCPRCGEWAETEIETFFGPVELVRYPKGSRVEWVRRKGYQNGGRPPDGSVDAEGYAVCPLCTLDYFVRVLIRQDVIEGVVPDRERTPYIADPRRTEP